MIPLVEYEKLSDEERLKFQKKVDRLIKIKRFIHSKDLDPEFEKEEKERRKRRRKRKKEQRKEIIKQRREQRRKNRNK